MQHIFLNVLLEKYDSTINWMGAIIKLILGYTLFRLTDIRKQKGHVLSISVHSPLFVESLSSLHHELLFVKKTNKIEWQFNLN